MTFVGAMPKAMVFFRNFGIIFVAYRLYKKVCRFSTDDVDKLFSKKPVLSGIIILWTDERSMSMNFRIYKDLVRGTILTNPIYQSP